MKKISGRLPIVSLGVVLLCGALGHLGLLIFERPSLLAWVRHFTGEPQTVTSTLSLLTLLIIHLLVNLSLGAAYGVLAKPQSTSEHLIGSGFAAGGPNTLCTFVGALGVVNTELPRLSQRLMIDFNFLYGVTLINIALLALVTGLLAAPLGIVGCRLAVKLNKSFQRLGVFG